MALAGRAALTKKIEALRAEFSQSDMERLRSGLIATGIDEAHSHILMNSRALKDLAVLSKPQRSKRLRELHPGDEDRQLLQRYCVLALLSRAFALLEYLAIYDASLLSRTRWADRTAMEILVALDDDEEWLWPFSGPSPWEEPQDPDEDDD